MCVYAQAHMLQHAKGACERMSNKREQLVEVGSFLYSLHVGPGIGMGSYCLSWLHQEIMHKHGHRASLSREALIETPFLGDFRLCQVGTLLRSGHSVTANGSKQRCLL